jgi:hypothetical protein
MPASQSIVPLEFDNEVEEEERVEMLLNGAHVDPGVGYVASPGQQKMARSFEAHLFAGSLPIDTYAEIVKAASEAATLAVFRALEPGAMRQPRRAPAPCDSPGSDGDEEETDSLQPFTRTSSRCCVFVIVTFFQHRQEKRGFHVLTRTSSWTCVIFTCGYSRC